MPQSVAILCRSVENRITTGVVQVLRKILRDGIHGLQGGTSQSGPILSPSRDDAAELAKRLPGHLPNAKGHLKGDSRERYSKYNFASFLVPLEKDCADNVLSRH